MTLWRYFCSGLALMLVPFVHTTAYAGRVLEEADVEKFTWNCDSSQGNGLEFKFSPVRRLSEESRAEGQWSYEFATEDEKYPDNKVSLPVSGAVRVDLVTQLNKSDSDIGEGYLWNVIVAPTVNGWGFGGHWPSKKPITEYQRLKNKKESLINMAMLSVQDGQPVHTKISPQDIDSAGTLNNAWEDIFGRKIVSNLVYPGSKGARSDQSGYSLTFYYVPTPALRFINEDGYKWPSFKHIDKEGKVFGFVLTPEGECLAWNSIDIVKN